MEEWATLRNDRQGQQGDSYERAVAAFDLFILDDAPEGDLDDVSLRGTSSFSKIPSSESSCRCHPGPGLTRIKDSSEA